MTPGAWVHWWEIGSAERMAAKPSGGVARGCSGLRPFAPRSVAPTSSNSLCGSGMTPGAWVHWWEIGSAERMAAKPPGGVVGLCCGLDIRRSVEPPRSEERRVGKEWRYRWWADISKRE